jgi:hypothetical protein
MRDNVVETKLRLLTLQLDNWKKLHDVITYGLDKTNPMISAERERQFTEIRASLLQETAHVFGELGILAELSGRAMNVLQRCVSVRGVRELSNEEVRRLESEWNGVFTKLGVVQGQLKSRRKALAGQTPLTYYLSRIFPALQPAGRR